MTKNELITRVANEADVTKAAAERVIDSLVGTITDTLKSGGEVELRGIGKFSVADRAAKIGRNPATGQEITIPARKAPAFKVSSTLKAALN